MNHVLTLALALLSTTFETTIDRAFTAFRNSEWSGAASALDRAYDEDPALFAANNFHYLRGRVAENQRDWKRAQREFGKIEPANPLHKLATWHSALAAARLRDDDSSVRALVGKLPRDFPASLKMQLASVASPALASEIYRGVNSREARFELAKIDGDMRPLWSLIQTAQQDDVALQSAHILVKAQTSSRDQMTIAATYMAHRQFDYALPLYQGLSADPAFAPNA